MKKGNKIIYRDVLMTFDVLNKSEYGITVIGDPNQISSYLVMNLSTDFVKNYIIGLLSSNSISDTDKELLESKLKELPKNPIIKPFKIILDKTIFNDVLKDYKIPMNVFPREVPSKEVTFEGRYFMTMEPTKIVIKFITKVDQYPFNKFNGIPASTPYLHGNPRDKVSSDLFDCQIQLNKEKVIALINEGGLKIGDIYLKITRTFRKG